LRNTASFGHHELADLGGARKRDHVHVGAQRADDEGAALDLERGAAGELGVACGGAVEHIPAT